MTKSKYLNERYEVVRFIYKYFHFEWKKNHQQTNVLAHKDDRNLPNIDQTKYESMSKIIIIFTLCNEPTRSFRL